MKMGLKEIGFLDVVGFICLCISPTNMLMTLRFHVSSRLCLGVLTITVSRILLNGISSRLLAFVYYFLRHLVRALSLLFAFTGV